MSSNEPRPVPGSPVLNVRGLSKSFGRNRALGDVSLTLRSGEIHALMGENGAGKSTLIKVLTGIYPRDEGEIRLDGRPIASRSAFEAQNEGISTVYQEINLIPNLSVAENISLGREPRWAGFINWGEINRRAERALARLQLDIDVRRPLESYSIAIQQMTAIARALDQNAKVLILDEATSSLDVNEVEQLFDVLGTLKEQGLAILFVTHFLDQVYAISDRITILRNGRFVGEFRTEELPRVQLIAKMMGQELKEADAEVAIDKPRQTNASGETWLECERLGRRGELEPIDLMFRKGECLGLAGLLGSGRTETARLLFGLKSADSGRIKIDGHARKINNPRDSVRAGFALLPEDRKSEGIFPELSVRENIVLALQARRGWLHLLSRREQEDLASRYIKALCIRAEDAEQPIQTLSGGNQQKAILARWLAMEPRLLILDEPTRGIDVGAKAEILRLVRKLTTEAGRSVLFISSELEEIILSCDRIAVLKDRRKIGELSSDRISETRIMNVIANGGLP